MKTKNFLHLVAFVLTFAVSVSVAGVVKSFQGLTTPEKITQIIAKDIENGMNRRQDFSRDYYVYALATNDYVTVSENLDVSDLPSDFQAAWQKHMQAWRTHSDFLNEAGKSSEIDSDFREISSRQINEINRTWYEVIRIARSYKAAIPRNAFS